MNSGIFGATCAFWDTYGDFIGIVVCGFAGGFAGWVFTNKKLRRTRGSKSSGTKFEPQAK